jgi:DNA-binding PucR family transcriptional regulator
MLMLSSIAIDPSLSAGGVWAPYMGGEFLLARKGSNYNARLAELYNEHRDVLEKRNEDQTLTPPAVAKMQEIYTIAFCEHCLLDWRNVGEKGEGELKYTAELGTKLLLDPRYAELAQFLESYSLNHMNYRSAAEQEVAKVVKSSAVS